MMKYQGREQGGVNNRNTKEGSREGLMIEIPRKGGVTCIACATLTWGWWPVLVQSRTFS